MSTRLIATGAILTLACHNFSEPGETLGALEVVVTVTGMPTDSAAHAVLVTLAEHRDLPPQPVAYSGGSVLFPGLPAGTHAVRLEAPAATCWVTSRNPRAFTVAGGETSRVGFAVSCFGPPAIVLNRTSPHSQALEANVGALSERYVLEPGGTFRLQFRSTRYGLGEYRGTYTMEGAEFRFVFDGNGDWQASGTQLGPCLAVAYNLDMGLSDFEDGEYCPGSSTRETDANGN
jgi:hypothetical protein